MKARGELVEIKFLLSAHLNSLAVSIPWGESRPYDFIVEYKGKISKVQVKSTFVKSNAYLIKVIKGRMNKYVKGDFDILAAYIYPTNSWYIIPFSEINTKTSFYFYPEKENKGMYENYRENWRILK